MNAEIIFCPHCKKEIAITEAITHQLRAQIQKESELEVKERNEKLAERERSLAEREALLAESRNDIEIELRKQFDLEKESLTTDLKEQVAAGFRSQVLDLQNVFEETRIKLRHAEENEIKLRKTQRELEERAQLSQVEFERKVDQERQILENKFSATEDTLRKEAAARLTRIEEREKELEQKKLTSEKNFEERVKSESVRLEQKARQDAEKSLGIEIRDLRSQVEEKQKELLNAQEFELHLRKEKRELENEKKTFELELTRKLDQERKQIRDETARTLTEDFQLKQLDKEKLIGALKEQLVDAQRKIEQGSQERQGEVLELELEEILATNFRQDKIEPVSRGTKGADVIQKVYNPKGQLCGTIIWESKRTKSWNEAWIQKLRDDQRESKAEIAAILTIALPEPISTFGQHKGIWVTGYSCLIGLANALRINLIALHESTASTVGKNEKMEALYAYLSGPSFRQRVDGIVEAFMSLKDDLNSERRSMMRIWAKRDKQIERVLANTVSMYGDMQGIISSLPKIKSLELKSSPLVLPSRSAKEKEDDD